MLTMADFTVDTRPYEAAYAHEPQRGKTGFRFVADGTKRVNFALVAASFEQTYVDGLYHARLFEVRREMRQRGFLSGRITVHPLVNTPAG